MKMICRLPVAAIYKNKAMEDQLLLGQHCEIIRKTGEFYYIKTEYGYYGCIKKSALVKNSRFDSLPCYIITSAFAAVLKKPDIHSQLICTLPKGAAVAFMCTAQNGFCKIMLPGGITAFCRLCNCRPAQNPYAKKESALRKAICDNALSYIGCEYLWGGKTPLGIDCSGLAFMSYYLEGITVYRDAVLKKGYAPKQIQIDNAKKGDLLYFAGHVAIYLGGERFVHSTAHAGSEGVCIASLNPKHKEYRPDLAASLYAAASIF